MNLTEIYQFKKPKNVTEANQIILMLLKVIGLLPIFARIEENNVNLNVPIFQLLLSTIVILTYVICTIDQFYMKSNENFFGKVKQTIQFVGVFLQLVINATAIIVAYGLNYLYAKCIIKFFVKLQRFDRKLPNNEIMNLNIYLFKISVILTIFTLLNASPLLWFFCDRTSKILGVRGIIRCFLYILPFLIINILLWIYISIVFMLNQRFKLINNKLDMFTGRSKQINNGPNTISALLQFHTDLIDVKRNVKNTSLHLVIFICLLANFVSSTYDIFSVILTFLYSKEIDDDFVYALFATWWQILNFFPMFGLVMNCERCSKEVRLLLLWCEGM